MSQTPKVGTWGIVLTIKGLQNMETHSGDWYHISQMYANTVVLNYIYTHTHTYRNIHIKCYKYIKSMISICITLLNS